MLVKVGSSWVEDLSNVGARLRKRGNLRESQVILTATQREVAMMLTRGVSAFLIWCLPAIATSFRGQRWPYSRAPFFQRRLGGRVAEAAHSLESARQTGARAARFLRSGSHIRCCR